MSVCKIPKECVSVVHTRLTNYLLPTLHAPWFYTPIGEVINTLSRICFMSRYIRSRVDISNEVGSSRCVRSRKVNGSDAESDGLGKRWVALISL